MNYRFIDDWEIDDPAFSWIDPKDLQTFGVFKFAFKAALWNKALGRLFIPVVRLSPWMKKIEYGLNWNDWKVRDQLSLVAIRSFIDDGKLTNLGRIAIERAMCQFLELENDKTPDQGNNAFRA